MDDRVTVVRWHRYGQDRLYVNAADGTRLGFADLIRGSVEVSDERRRKEVEQALCAHPAWSSVPPSAPGGVATGGQDQAAKDLSQNAAGGAARARAIEERQAAPVRTFVARVFGIHTQERAWRIGADGEEDVARQLGKLGPDWRMLHAVPVGRRGADIDHVVMGPGGVFTINTKTHPGAKVWVGAHTVMIGRSKLPYVRNSRFEARACLPAAVSIARQPGHGDRDRRDPVLGAEGQAAA